MGTANGAYNLAKQYIGYREGPNNDTMFGDYTGYPNQKWCGSFCKYILDHSGTTGEPSPVWTPGGAAAYKASRRWVTRDAIPPFMSLVFFDWGGSQSPAAADHVGFFLRKDGDRIVTIEGNTSAGQAGSQSNGDGCYQRTRPLNVVIGYGLPAYQPEPPPVFPTAPPQEDDMPPVIVDTPDGKHWRCDGAFRTEISADDANFLQFIGTRRQAVDANFQGVMERTLVDAKAAPQAFFYAYLTAKQTGAIQ